MNKHLNRTLVSLSLIGLLTGCAANQYPVTTMQPLSVEQQCQSSFWLDCVTYPFPVKFTQTNDNKVLTGKSLIWMNITVRKKIHLLSS